MLVIKDFATTILASALTAAATSVVVSDASRLPALSAGDYYYLVLQKFTDRTNVEVVKVTGAAGNTLTVVRAQAGTTAKSFAIGDYAEQRVTVGTFSEYIAQSVAGKVDKSDGYVEQSLGLLNTGDSVKATVGISYDATNGHGTILSGGEGANKATPYVALRPLGVADSSVQLKYAQDGSLILSGGSRYVETGLLSMKHPSDGNGWPNATNGDANNYNNRARSKVHVNNNALYFIADGASNARRFGIQSGHEDPGYATAYGVLDLNPFGGTVRVNGGTVYHTNYVPTPAAVGALALSGGVLTGTLDQNIGGYGVRMLAAGGAAYLQGGKVGGDNADQKLKITGISATALTEFDIITAGHGIARVNGARIYTEQYVPTPSVLGVVPQARTINGKPLTADITLSAADVGALPITGGVLTGVLEVPTGFKVAAKDVIGAAGDTVRLGDDSFGTKLNFNAKDGEVSVQVTAGVLHRVYHEAFKPTAADVGALPVNANAVSATKLLTARTINGADFDGTANITTANWGTARTLTIGNAAKSVNGGADVAWSLAEIGAASASHTHNTIVSVDNRALKPSGSVARALNMYFTSKGGLTGTADTVYGDLLVLNGYSDTSGGVQNALFFGKTAQEIIHYQGAIGATQWSSAQTIAYTSSNVASATKLATARQINGTDFDGSGNITTANWGTARTLTIGNAAKSVNGAGNVSWSLSEIGAVPQARTINTKPLTSDIVLSAADVGAVPQARTINGKPLTADITLYAADVGAVKQYDRFVASNAVGNDYYQCAIEVNGNTAIDSRPGIGFHMAGRFASTLHLWEGGDFRFHTQGLASYAGIMTGNVNANDVYIRSDRRLKKNLVEVRDALRKVSSLTAYSYDKKQTLEATEYDKKEVGLIAQDVEQVLPEAVTRVVDSSNKDGTEILTLSNSALIALLVEAVKELSEKVKELEHGRT